MSNLVFVPTPAEGDDRFCSCVICHLPRRESDGVEHGKPVEWVVRMRLHDQTIWQGLHTECWERNRQEPDPESGIARLEQLIERLGPEPDLSDVEVDMSVLFPNDPPETLCLSCARPYGEHESWNACGDEGYYSGATPERMQLAWDHEVRHMLTLGMDPVEMLERAMEGIAAWKGERARDVLAAWKDRWSPDE